MNVKLKTLTMAATIALAAFSVAGAAHARDQIQIAGSSTVLPYANIVAEQFGQTFPQFKTPVVESGGSGGGLKQFCGGVGLNQIDIANSSRPIKEDEKAACAAAGVTDIIEVRFGYDGIVFASDVNGPEFAFTPADWFLALGANVPVGGKLVENPNKTWKDVNANFPDWKITALIPGEKHGTREVFEEKVLAAGCKATGALDLLVASGLDKKDAEKACVRVRTDGASIDIDGDYTETLGRLQSNKQAIGVFGLSFYENNIDKLRVATIGGVSPSVASIASGEYPVSRPLFFYVKKAHIGVIPGLKEYAEYFLSDGMAGPDGPLAEYGLVPLPADEHEAVKADLAAGKTL
ncbi:MAG: substrate-binding domain-containing protein [Parvibaculum sp.]|jgi:phosphate transport system substrate-binding protein